MWAMLVVGLVFLAGVAYNVFGPEPNPTEATAGAVIAATLIGLFVLTRYHETQAAAFERWLTHNRSAIEHGGSLYANEVLITPATRLTRYQVALSFLIVSFKVPTRIYIVGHHATGFVAALCTVISLALGWWGIPWGPVYTVQVIIRNLRGGLSQNVAERLATVPAAVGSDQHLPTGSVKVNPKPEARVK
jgi:hypothetical protein